MNETTLGYFVLMLIAGIGIPVMAGMNTGVGLKIGSPLFAVFLLCLVATMASGLVVLLKGVPDLGSLKTLPPFYFFAGFLFLLYIFSITISAPIIGLGNAVFLVLIGQLVAAAVIDHYGLFGVPVSEITFKRAAGLGIMIVGTFLARKEVINL